MDRYAARHLDMRTQEQLLIIAHIRFLHVTDKVLFRTGMSNGKPVEAPSRHVVYAKMFRASRDVLSAMLSSPRKVSVDSAIRYIQFLDDNSIPAPIAALPNASDSDFDEESAPLHIGRFSAGASQRHRSEFQEVERHRRDLGHGSLRGGGHGRRLLRDWRAR
jgi:hypothetical protein